ncbi:MAG TPA: hypothetical protein DDW27_02585 [Bacteroidales bacterium]|nr:hypothetical protein [Bacteroidales bacterium]
MAGIKEVLIFLLAGISASISGGCSSGRSQPGNSNIIEIRGIYGSPNPFWNKGLNLNELNVNAVFLNWKGINEKLIERAESEGAEVFAEFPLLNGRDYVEKHPEAWAIDNNGEKVKPASWFMGVCPTEPGFRQFRMMELRGLLRKFNIGGVWLDYVHWHAQFEEPEPVLPETCFCENCIRTFEASAGIDVPDADIKKQALWILTNCDALWREWRCSVIADWVRDARMILKQEDPDALLGLYHCPWDDNDFDGARYRILGLDYNMLKEVTDVFSPMVYHGRMGRSPVWVKENIEWFCNALGTVSGSFPEVWPIVQSYNDPYQISPQEFEDVLSYGSGACSTGIMMFTSNSVAGSDEKTETLKRVYSRLMTNQ